MSVIPAISLVKGAIPKSLRTVRFGLVVHPASVDRHLKSTIENLLDYASLKVTALFGPQHGIRGETQDNMVEWEGFRDPKTGLPVFSLYGEHRKPTTEMLDLVDCMVIDLQDVGSRYYTFLWTMALVMEACMECGKAVLVLDRPNPISCLDIEGPLVEEGYFSFVGLHPLPVRHGMTIGEVAQYLQDRFYPGLQLHVIKMKGYRRRMYFDDTGLPWVMPSPNMPTIDTALVYPGQCLLEGTTISEGRGTTKPFEVFGAPFINPDALLKRLRDFPLRGVVFRPMYFIPTFHKFAGQLCGGIQLHVTDRRHFRPFKTSVAILKAIRELYPKERLWRDPPYEYEYEKLPIDILSGSDRLRHEIDQGVSLKDSQSWWTAQAEDFDKSFRKKYLLYQ
jgi:uncharacterized protein YbbC (DUF1343 family)